MSNHDQLVQRALDDLYGLLDAHESQALRAELATPEGQRARGEAERIRDLLASAATVSFPEARFVLPTSEPKRSASPGRFSWVGWVIAASLLVALGIPAGSQYMSLRHLNHQAEVAQREAEEARLALEHAGKDWDAAKRAALKEYQDAQSAFANLSTAIHTELEQARNDVLNKKLNVVVSGPAAVTPGAPNIFKIETRDLSGTVVNTRLNARVTDQAGRVVYDDGARESRAGLYTLKLPADLPLTPDRDLKLEVTATPPAGPATQLKQSLPLAPPVYLVHLTTDKPLYQPGETVHFRALVLDRLRLKPPTEEMVLSVGLVDPQGAELQTVQGREHSLTEKGDRVPGVFASEFVLPESAVGGEYALKLRDAGDRIPEQLRKILVNKYQPAQLQKELEFTRKSYGPGDEVVAMCKVSRVSGPVAGQPVKAEAQLDGLNLPVEVSGTTDAQGGVTVKFRLPAAIERGDASITVNFTDGGANESLSKPVPVIVKKLLVEFYPEGGDLVAGVTNRVYFQALTPLGKAAELRGRLVDNAGATVARLETMTDDTEPGINQGQGRFEFKPVAGASYHVEVEQPAGLTAIGEFPKVKPEGVVLAAGTGVTSDDQPFAVDVTSAERDRTLIVGAYARGRLLDHQRVNAPAGKPQRVELAAAPGFGGVTRVTVFTETGEGVGRTLTPVAERLVYRTPTRKTVLKVEPDRQAYAPGEKVHLKVSAVDEKGAPASAVAMLGVVNQSVVVMADEKTFRSMPTHFLLTGEVEKADDLEHVDVLLGNHPKAPAALDLLLGVQGWRRFKEQGPDVPQDKAKNVVAKRSRPPQVSVDSFTAVSVAVLEAKRPEIAAAKTRLERSELQVEAVQPLPAYLTTQHQKAEQARITAQALGQSSAEKSDSIREIARTLLTIVAMIAAVIALASFVIAVLKSRSSVIAWTSLAVTVVGGLACLNFPVQSQKTGESDLAIPDLRSNQNVTRGFVDIDGVPNAPGAEREVMLGAAGDAKPGDAGGRGRPSAMAPAAAPAPMVRDPERLVYAAARPGQKTGQAAETKKDAQPEARRYGHAGSPSKVAKNEKEQFDRKRLPQREKAKQGFARRIMPVPDRTMGERFAGYDLSLQHLGLSFDDPPITPPTIVREFAHKHTPSPDGVRDDFTETVFWHPALVLANGSAEVSFDLSDSVTRYQVLAAAHTADGRLGSNKTEIAARKPVTVEPKLPVEVTAGDRIDIPVTFANETEQSRPVKLTVESPGLAPVGDQPAKEWTLAANSRERRVLGFRPLVVEGTARLRLSIAGEDAIEMKLPVVPDGFPVTGSISDELRGSAKQSIILPATWVPDTLKCEVAIFPTPLADLQRGLEGLLQEPHGCFEQTSTTNYPNTLILDYLRETGQADPALVAKARGMLDRGYTKLLSFEVPQSGKREGYEWFGHAPAHEALTAYGLLQFREMACFADVDPAMLARTREYLLSRRDAKGGFQRSQAALDSFGRASEQVTNAYIVWAITESGRDEDVTTELARLQREAQTEKDPYFLALVANALLNRNRYNAAAAILTKLVTAQAADGSLTGTTTSITGSHGQSLSIETTALAVLGWLKAEQPGQFGGALRNATQWIGKQRHGTGTFGPTQSTILALKALVAYARAYKQPPEAGEITLSLGDEVIGKRAYTATTKDAIVIEIPTADKKLKPGENTFTVMTNGKNLYPYTVSWTYQTRQPPSAETCPVRLAARLEKENLAEGDSTRLLISLENVSKQGQGMTTAIIGLPAGLKLPDDFKQLKDLAMPRDGKVGPIAAWELRGRELILYWRDLAPDAKVNLAVDVLANVPGRYNGPASRAYLYYDPDAKHWVAPLSATISAK
ncbi:MAG: MG2 domain-containing protein [Gemmataceae bacterium]